MISYYNDKYFERKRPIMRNKPNKKINHQDSYAISFYILKVGIRVKQ